MMIISLEFNLQYFEIFKYSTIDFCELEPTLQTPYKNVFLAMLISEFNYKMNNEIKFSKIGRIAYNAVHYFLIK